MNIIKEIKYKNYIIQIKKEGYIYEVSLFDPKRNSGCFSISVNFDELSDEQRTQIINKLESNADHIEKYFEHQIDQLKQLGDTLELTDKEKEIQTKK